VRMIILLINNQNVKDKGYDLKGEWVLWHLRMMKL